MLSEKQLIANLKNCLKSTGPRTFEGKQASSQNSYKHGLRSSHILARNRDKAEFDQFRKDLHAQLSPVGLIEFRLVDQAAAALWKMQCLDQLEPQVLEVLQDRYLDSRAVYEKEVLKAEKRIL